MFSGKKWFASIFSPGSLIIGEFSFVQVVHFDGWCLVLLAFFSYCSQVKKIFISLMALISSAFILFLSQVPFLQIWIYSKSFLLWPFPSHCFDLLSAFSQGNKNNEQYLCLNVIFCQTNYSITFFWKKIFPHNIFWPRFFLPHLLPDPPHLSTLSAPHLFSLYL